MSLPLQLEMRERNTARAALASTAPVAFVIIPLRTDDREDDQPQRVERAPVPLGPLVHQHAPARR
jgi:hypothetical protein